MQSSAPRRIFTRRPRPQAASSSSKVDVVVGGIPSAARRVDVFRYFNKIKVNGSIKFPYKKLDSLKESQEKVALAKKFNCALIQLDHLCPARNAVRQIEQVPFTWFGQSGTEKNLTKGQKNDKAKDASGSDENSTFLYAVVASELNSAAFRRTLKDGRLVVRNLSFRVNEQKLQETFERFGEVTEVCIPRKEDGLKRGFAFVEFSSKQNAAVAQNAMNGKSIGDRAIRVERAVPKEIYVTVGSSDASKSVAETTEAKPKTSESAPMDCDETNEESEEEEGEEDGDEEDGNGTSKCRKIMFGDDSDSDDEHDETLKQDAKPKTRATGKTSASAAQQKLPQTKAAQPREMNDAADGKTLFVRNVPFDAEESSVRSVFERFGAVEYCKLVRDRVSGLVRNCGFVRFASLDVAAKVLNLTDEERHEQLQLDETAGDRIPLAVMRAVTRDTLKNMIDEREKQRDEERHVDRRNMHLLQVRCTDERTLASLTDLERSRRDRIGEELTQRLRNPLVFVSMNRVCLHNLPKNVDDAALKKALLAFLRHSGTGPRITECRVIRDHAKTSSAASSRQYAFVAFQHHDDARQAVLKLDCNRSLFASRIFAEFALENRARVRNKLARFERQRAPELHQLTPKTQKNSAAAKKRTQKSANSKSAPNKNTSTNTIGSPKRAATKRAVLRTFLKLKQKRAKLT